MEDHRTKMDKYRDWVRQPKVFVSHVAFMSVLFIGFWFETSSLVVKLVIAFVLVRSWWEVFNRWKAVRRRE